MASMYAQYLRERTGDSILETEHGFATYRYLNEGKTVYIIDIFVLPEFRREGISSVLINEILEEAKEKGCTEFIGSIVPSTKNSTESLKMFLGPGVSLVSAANDFIILRKDI